MSRSSASFIRSLRRGYLALVSLAVASCSYSYPIDVSFIKGKVAFSAKEHSSSCLNYLEVKSETGELMWRFEGPLQLSSCRSAFPLIYGKVPQSATAATQAKRLLPNTRYYIAASDGDSYYGSFRLKHVVAIDSDPQEGRNGPYFNSRLNGVDAMTEQMRNVR